MVAEKKRGGNSSSAIFMKLSAALSGVALGAVSCLACYDPVPVHADSGNFVGAVDYILAQSGSDAGFIMTPGGGYVAGAVLGIYMCTRSPMYAGLGDIDASTVSFISGYYTWNGELKTAYSAICGRYHNNIVDSRQLLCVASDFTVTAVGNSDITICNSSQSVVNGVGYSTNTFAYGSSSSSMYMVVDSPFADSGQFPIYYRDRNFFASVRYVSDGGLRELANTSAQYIASGCNYEPSPVHNLFTLSAYDFLPSGNIDFADPMPYIDNVLRPYVVEYYPEYIYLLPEPEPDPPQYATGDIVPGIPKDWTIINPELPTSPHLDLTIPDGDFREIDPGDTFTGFASGVGFWWAMVNEILTTFHIKTLALALLAVAVAIFALYKIGG